MTTSSDVSNEPELFESNSQLANVMGLPKLLLAVASRLENSGEGVSKELLVRAARRITDLEAIAIVATHIVSLVPRKKDKQRSSKVPRETLMRLCDVLNEVPEFRVRRIR